jgi:hypothetical protein
MKTKWTFDPTTQLVRLYSYSGSSCKRFTYWLPRFANYRKQGMSRDFALWHSLTHFESYDVVTVA